MSKELFTFENRPNRNIVRFSETEEEVTVKTVPVKETRVSVPEKTFKYSKAPKETVSTFSAGTGVDNTRREPVVTLATLGAISSTILEVTFSEKMVSPSADYKTGFSVTANGLAKTISSGALHTDDTKIRLTLASAGDGIETYTVSYTSVTGDITSNKGAELLTFSSRAVTNTCAGVLDHGTPYVWINANMPWSLWADDSKTVQITDGTGVYVVSNPNGGTLDLTQATAGARPTYEDTPFLTFDGGDYLGGPVVSGGGTNNAFTLAVVAKFSVNGGYMISCESGGAGWSMALGGAAGDEFEFRNTAGAAIGNTSITNNAKRLLVIHSAINGGNYDINMRINGALDTVSTIAAWTQNGTIQVGINPNNSAKITGTLYELLWYPGGVSNLANFETFMMTRHGL